MKTVIEKGSIEKLNGQNPTRIYYDRETSKVWVNVYADGNSFDNYHSGDIIEVRQPVEADWSKWTKKNVVESIRWTLEQTQIENQYK